MRDLTVGDLKRALENVPDDTATTGLWGGGMWHEDYGEELTPEADYGQRRPVFLIE